MSFLSEFEFEQLSCEMMAAIAPEGAWLPAKWQLFKNLKQRIICADIEGFHTFEEKRDALRYKLFSRPKCSCGAYARMYHGSQITKYGFFSRTCTNIKCAMNDPITKQKIQDTIHSKYEGGLKNAVIRNKVKNTNSVKTEAQRAATYQKQVQTNLEKYGGIFGGKQPDPTQRKRNLEKLKSAIIEKYGVGSMLQLHSVQEHSRKLAKQQYNDTVFPNTVAALRKKGLLVEGNWTGWRSKYAAYCTVCSSTVTLTRLNKDTCCPNCFTRSKPQLFVSQLLTTLGVEFKENDRTVIKPKELDFVIPKLNIAIEVNGIYWHRDGASVPILEKTLIAEKHGFQVLHFWDFEILMRPQAVKNMIISKLGLAKKIYARNTVLQEISSETAAAFLDEYHIMGHVACRTALGLFYQGQLVAVATFGRERFSNAGQIELLRFASIGTIVGGLSKLIGPIKGPIVTFADRRFSKQITAYDMVGFKRVTLTKPNYFYHKGLKIVKRYSAQKHKLANLLGDNFNPLLSEVENMTLAGYHRCFDCGNLKYVK